MKIYDTDLQLLYDDAVNNEVNYTCKVCGILHKSLQLALDCSHTYSVPTISTKTTILNKISIDILGLPRYSASACAGWEGSGATWTELDLDEEGDLIKYEDLINLLNKLRNE